MSIQTGYLDSAGHPRLTIQVSGTSPNTCADCEALIDTGFTGFLMLPIAQALPLGLVLLSTSDYVLANGQPITCYLARGTVSVEPPSVAPALPFMAGCAPPVLPAGATVMQPETVDGLIALEGDGAILGMDFLRSLNKWLVVGKNVSLIDDALF